MKENKQTPRLTLVGAGPGDPDLITVKGIKALADADIVLYDALANTELLDFCPNRTLKIFVGKRAGKHSMIQNEINRMIVEYAFSHGHVVRLKGGDPFVFGRGYEELQHARSFGIEVNVVPGISSSYGVPALKGIPLTHRGIAESFWVITGTTRSGALSKDIFLAAQSTATVIILMGMKKLEEITEIFKAYDKKDTSVAIVQNGSLPNEKLGTGTVSTILNEVQKKDLKAPAIIIIGEVVKDIATTDLIEVAQSVKPFKN